MNFLLSALLCAPAVLADYVASVSAVDSAAKDLASKVNAFKSSDGLVAALGIQNDYGPLSSAVVALSGAAADAKDADIDVGATQTLESSISSLLDGLTAKAGDFTSIGAAGIVKNDISQLQGPAVGIVSGIVNAVSGDSAKIGSLTSALQGIENAFASADSAYGIATSAWPSPQ